LLRAPCYAALATDVSVTVYRPIDKYRYELTHQARIDFRADPHHTFEDRQIAELRTRFAKIPVLAFSDSADQRTAEICAEFDGLDAALAQEAAWIDERPLPQVGTKQHRKRPPLEAAPLTEKQTEVVQIVGECKGNFAEAGRRLGLDRKTVKQHYQAAMGKMGKAAIKRVTGPLPCDRRGQSRLTDDDDRRL
jgi:hypothetical protein